MLPEWRSSLCCVPCRDFQGLGGNSGHGACSGSCRWCVGECTCELHYQRTGSRYSFWTLDRRLLGGYVSFAMPFYVCAAMMAVSLLIVMHMVTELGSQHYQSRSSKGQDECCPMHHLSTQFSFQLLLCKSGDQLHPQRSGAEYIHVFRGFHSHCR